MQRALLANTYLSSILSLCKEPYNPSHRSLKAAINVVQALLKANAALPMCMLHGDMNEHNVLVDAGAQTVVGIIDAGDFHYGWRVAELGVACTYQAGIVVAGLDDTGTALSVGMRAAADVVVRVLAAVNMDV